MDNTADTAKLVSAATRTALDAKVDKVTGKGLSAEGYTTAEKTKLAGVASGATQNSSDASLLDRSTHYGAQAISTATRFQTALDGKQSALGFATENAANKAQAGGYASLDGGGKVPVSQLPSSLMEYKGVWNASTNSPTLADGSGDQGDVYCVSTVGTHNLGLGSITFDVGDYVIYNGTARESPTRLTLLPAWPAGLVVSL